MSFNLHMVSVLWIVHFKFLVAELRSVEVFVYLGNSPIEHRSRVQAQFLVLCPLLPFTSELWSPYSLLHKYTSSQTVTDHMMF